MDTSFANTLLGLGYDSYTIQPQKCSVQQFTFTIHRVYLAEFHTNEYTLKYGAETHQGPFEDEEQYLFLYKEMKQKVIR